MRSWSLRLAFVLGLTGSCVPLAAQNLLVNPRFDSNLSGWTPNAGTTDVHGSKDVAGSTGSGSAFVTNHSGQNSDSEGITQCVPVTGGTKIDFGGFIFFPSGQIAGDGAFVGVQFFGAGCEGLVSSVVADVSLVPDAWVSSLATGVAVPAGAKTAKFVALARKALAGGSTVAYFDNLLVRVSEESTTTVVASASIHGQNGAFFHSDLWITNLSYGGPATIHARYRCFAGQTCPAGEKTMILSPRATGTFEDVVSQYFVAPETAGTIELTTSTLTPLLVDSRVYTPAQPSPTQGTAVPGLPASAARTRTIFNGLGSNGGNLSGGFRSNAGAYNPTDESVEVTFTLFGADGATLGSKKLTTPAHTPFQINDIFGAAGAGTTVTTSATLVVTAPVPVFAQATLIDNKSGDSVYLPGAADLIFTDGP